MFQLLDLNIPRSVSLIEFSQNLAIKPVVSKYVVDVAGVVNLHIYTAVISLLASIFVCVNGFHTAN